MMKKMTYQKKLKLILIAIGLFSIVVYNFSIGDTLDLWSKKNEVEEQVSNNQNAHQQIELLKGQLSKMENLLGNQIEQTEDPHQVLLESVTSYTQENELILTSFPQPFTSTENGYLTMTSMLTVEGRFIPLLQLSDFLEKEYNAGKIVAMNFEVRQDLKRRKRILSNTIYIQHVKAIKDETTT